METDNLSSNKSRSIKMPESTTNNTLTLDTDYKYRKSKHNRNRRYMSESLPNNLDIPDILPDNLRTEINKASVPFKHSRRIDSTNMSNTTVMADSVEPTEAINTDCYAEPMWLQTSANGTVILPDKLKPIPPLYIPPEFLAPNVGIITPSPTYSNVATNVNPQFRSEESGVSSHKQKTYKKIPGLFAENVNTAFSQLTNIDWTKNIIIVDLSYMTYKRFFATRTWYNNAFPERDIPKDHDWCKDEDFMAKFRKLFMKHLIAQGKSRNVPESNIIYAIDCRHVDNWRVKACKKYKSTRKESHIKNNFHNFDVFPIVRNEIIADMQNKTGNIMFVHKHLEADDVIALLVKYIRHRRKPKYDKSIYIVANDRDYIQICNDNTFLIDLDGKAISTLALSDTYTATDYLLAKMLQGDNSDNIPACYFSKEFLALAGIKTSRKHLKATPSAVDGVMKNSTTKQALLALMNKCRVRINDPGISYTNAELTITKDNQFDYNAKHMDFEHIPSKYATELNIVFGKCLRF